MFVLRESISEQLIASPALIVLAPQAEIVQGVKQRVRNSFFNLYVHPKLQLSHDHCMKSKTYDRMSLKMEKGLTEERARKSCLEAFVEKPLQNKTKCRQNQTFLWEGGDVYLNRAHTIFCHYLTLSFSHIYEEVQILKII